MGRNLRPGDDGDETDTNYQGVLNSVRHQESGQDTATENREPQLGPLEI